MNFRAINLIPTMAITMPSDSRIRQLRSKQLSQPGAVSAGTVPTKAQLVTDADLRSARQAREGEVKTYMQERYPSSEDTPADSTEKKKGFIGRALDVLNAPVAVGAGVVESLTGTGSEKGMLRNIVANVKERGCYSDDTEILTSDGFKLFKDVKEDEAVATLNPDTGFLEFQKITKKFEYQHDGVLSTIKNRTIDIAVTDNHNMWVSVVTSKDKKTVFRPYEMIQVRDLPNSSNIRVRRNCDWAGVDNGKSDDWFAFMGIYLADGCLASHGKSIMIAACTDRSRKRIGELLDRMGFRYSLWKSNTAYEILGEDELVEYVSQLGTALDKYVPSEIRNAPPEKIRIFVDWFCFGDGNVWNGHRCFYSSSKNLIDGIQECLIKIGNSGNIRVRDRRGKESNFRGRIIVTKNLAYEMNERVKKTHSSFFGKKSIVEVPYSGKVYCVEAPNHILLVRRNGKAYFCGNSYGDILRAKGVSNVAAMPVGLALDIALDPLNWLTAGTAAMVPRVAKGLYRGGLAGAKVGAESGAVLKASNSMRLVSARYRNLLQQMPQGVDAAVAATKASPLMRRLAVKATASDEMYAKIAKNGIDALTDGEVRRYGLFREGINRVKDAAGRNALTSKVSAFLKQIYVDSDAKIVDEFAEQAEKIAVSAKNRAKEFGYSDEAAKGAVLADRKARFTVKDPLVSTAAGEDSRRFGKVMFEAGFSDASDVVKGRKSAQAPNPIVQHLGQVNEVGSAVNDRKVYNDGVEKIAEMLSPRLYARSSVTDEKIGLLAAEELGMVAKGEKDAARIRKALASDKVKEVTQRIRETNAARTIGESKAELATALGRGTLDMDAMKRLDVRKPEEILQMIRTYRSFSVGLSGYDQAIARVVQNVPVAKVLDVYAKSIYAFKLAAVGLSPVSRINQIVDNIAQTSMAGINILNPAWFESVSTARKLIRGDIKQLEVLFGPKWRDTMLENAEVIAPVLGISPGLLVGGGDFVRQQLTDIARYAGKIPDESVKTATAAWEDMGKLFGFDLTAEERLVRQGTSMLGEGSSFLFGGERGVDSSVKAMLSRWKRLADEGGKGSEGYRLAHTLATAPLDDFGKYDSMYRIGTASHLVKNGVTEAEMVRLRNWYQFGPDDYVKGAAGTYTLTPKAAIRVVNTAYRNYQALPAWANVMRKMPVLGSPFFAFGLSSASNYAKALGINPAYFSRVSQLMREVGGDRTPLEKESIESKYYSYLGEEGMMKIPFFRENPMYMNMQNVFSHYTFSFLQPAQRTYGDKYGDSVAKAIDKNPVLSQFFKDPVGQWLMDYAIMPHLISEGLPQSQFGIPLYPEDATFGEKAGRAAAALATPYVPRPLGYAGIFPSPLPESIDDSITPYVPSYTYKALHNAIKGRTPSGMPASEDALSRTVRNVLRESGVPTYRMNLDFAAKEAKKKK